MGRYTKGLVDKVDVYKVESLFRGFVAFNFIHCRNESINFLHRVIRVNAIKWFSIFSST